MSAADRIARQESSPRLDDADYRLLRDTLPDILLAVAETRMLLEAAREEVRDAKARVEVAEGRADRAARRSEGLAGELTEALERAVDAEKRVAELLQSSSWRITAPVRAVVGRLRGRQNSG